MSGDDGVTGLPENVVKKLVIIRGLSESWGWGYMIMKVM